jgi:hypothetical protein
VFQVCKWALGFLLLCCCACGDDTWVSPDASDAYVSDSTDSLDAGSVDSSGNEAGPQDAFLDWNLGTIYSSDMIYNGGPVMVQPVKVYPIWYGAWDYTTIALVDDFIANFSSSNYYKTNTPYYEIEPDTDGGRTHVTSTVSFGGNLYDSYGQGKLLIGIAVWNIVVESLRWATLTLDPNAIYMVFTSSDVDEGEPGFGFCSDWCGWHDEIVESGFDVKFAFVGDSMKCPDSCSMKAEYDAIEAGTPNGDYSADFMVTVVAHEISEILSDPHPPIGWRDVLGLEDEDKTAWTFGTLYSTTNGSVANVHVGAREWLVQQNWTLFPDGGQGPSLGN